MAKKLTQRLIDLGANLFHKVGLGDYQHDFNYEGEYDPWMNNLWTSLQTVVKGKMIKTDELSSEESNKLLPPIYKVEVIGELSKDDENNTADKDDNLKIYRTLDQLPPPNGAINKKAYMSKVLANQRITSDDHFQDTRHIVLQISPDMSYEPGDIVMIQPRNDPVVIQEFIDRYNLKPTHLLKITVDTNQLGQVSQSSVIKFPEEGITVQELFEYWLNLMDPPSRFFVKVLSQFVEDQKRAEKLREFASKTTVS